MVVEYEEVGISVDRIVINAKSWLHNDLFAREYGADPDSSDSIANSCSSDNLDGSDNSDSVDTSNGSGIMAGANNPVKFGGSS